MEKVIVVHSGGMDSSICLALAIEKYGKKNILALSFSYHQRHEKAELQQAKKICEYFGIERKVVPIASLQKITSNALLDHRISIKHIDDEPNTLVLGRNGLMARLAAIHGNSLGASRIFMGIIGVEAANSGYRDCSREYMDLMEKILRIDLDDESFKIETPLVHMTKYETMLEAKRLGHLEFLLEETISCYEGIPKEGCQKCPACSLRNEGILEFKSKHLELKLSYLEKITQINS